MNPPDDNPFVAPQVPDHAGLPDGLKRQPGPVAIIFSVLVGIVVAAVTFCVTFFFTCLGVMAIDEQIGEAGEVFVFLVAGLTAIAALWLTVKILLWFVRIIKNRNRALPDWDQPPVSEP